MVNNEILQKNDMTDVNIEQKQKIQQKTQQEQFQKQTTFKTDLLIVSSLGIGFMIYYSSYLAHVNLVSQIYEQQNFVYLGNVSVFCIFGAFGLGSLIASYLAILLPYKYIMAICSIFVSFDVITGYLISECQNNDYFYCNTVSIYLIVIIFATVCGIFDATLWTAQGGYMNIIIKRNVGKDGLFYGLFWAITQLSQIFSMVLALVILQSYSQSTFFIVMTIVMIISSIIFLFLPNLQKNDNKISNDSAQKQPKNKETIRNIFKKIRSLFKLKESKYYFIYFGFGGCISGFIAGVLHIIIEKSLDSDLTDREVNVKTTYVYLCLGLFDSFSGIISGIVSDKMEEGFKFFKFSVYLVQLLVIVGILNYMYQQYWICFILAALCGICDCLFLNLSSIACTRDFNGRLQIFSLLNFFSGLTCSLTMTIHISLLKYPLYYFMGVVFLCSFLPLIATYKMKSPDKNKHSILNSFIPHKISFENKSSLRQSLIYENIKEDSILEINNNQNSYLIDNTYEQQDDQEDGNLNLDFINYKFNNKQNQSFKRNIGQ